MMQSKHERMEFMLKREDKKENIGLNVDVIVWCHCIALPKNTAIGVLTFYFSLSLCCDLLSLYSFFFIQLSMQYNCVRMCNNMATVHNLLLHLVLLCIQTTKTSDILSLARVMSILCL